MASKNPRLTQSPRALRDSTQSPLEHAQGTVPRDFAREPVKDGSPENKGAWAVFDEKGFDRSSGEGPAV
jgi:hypothetical protein